MKKDNKAIILGVTVDYQLRYHDGLEKALRKRGWDVHVVSSGGLALQKLKSERYACTHIIPMRRRPSIFRDILALSRWVALCVRVRPRIVMVGTPKASLLGLTAAFITRVPTRVYEVHGLRLEGASGVGLPMLWALEWLMCFFATEVVPVSRSVQVELRRRHLVSARKGRVLGAGSPNGVDVERFQKASRNEVQQEQTREVHGLDKSLPLVLFVGRLNEDKGLTCLARAEEALHGVEKAQLLVVGPVDDASGQEGLARLMRSGWIVRVAGEVQDVAPFYAVADAVCLPSKREGLPTVVLEAFASGVPVVATAATGTVDLVIHECTGLLVQINDDEALGQELTRALGEKELTRNIARNALEMVLDLYDQEVVQDRLIRWLEGKHHTRLQTRQMAMTKGRPSNDC